MIKTFEDGVTIRPFAMEDEPLVREFCGQFGPETRCFFDSGGGNSQLALSFFSGEAPSWPIEGYTPFLAEKDGLMVGYVFLWDTSKQLCWVGICVREECKGLHLGRRLMEFADEYAKSVGCRGILLTTGIANVRGQGLYAHMGYQALGIATDGEWMYAKSFQRSGEPALPAERTLEDGTVLRPFAVGDRDKVEEFFSQMGVETRNFFAQNSVNYDRAMSFFTGEAREDKIYPFLAEKNGVMEGYVFLHHMDRTIPWLGICLREDCKGKHLGRSLLQYMEDWAESVGCGGILLTTALANARAQALYRRMGYEYAGLALCCETLWIRRFANQ